MSFSRSLGDELSGVHFGQDVEPAPRLDISKRFLFPVAVDVVC